MMLVLYAVLALLFLLKARADNKEAFRQRHLDQSLQDRGVRQERINIRDRYVKDHGMVIFPERMEVCVGCQKQVDIMWTVDCETCGETNCYDHARVVDNRWYCTKCLSHARTPQRPS